MFDEFNKFSFVSKMDNDTYHIHEIMRKDLLAIIPEGLLKDINKSISQYYFSIFNESLLYTKRKLAARECIYHLKYCLVKHEYVNFLLNNIKDYFIELQNRGESAYLYDVLTDIFSYISYSDCIEFYKIYTDMIMLNGNFKEAVNNIGTFLKEYKIEQISQNVDILQLYVKKIKHQMVYESLNNTISLTKSIKSFIKNTPYYQQYLEVLFTEGNMLFEQGNFQECKECFDNIIKLCDDHNFIDIKCRTLRKQADYYLVKNNVYKASELCRNGLDIAENHNFERYGNYLECTQAEIYRKLKLFEQSRALYIKCQNKFSKLGIQPWVAHTELGLAMIDLEQENYYPINLHLNIAERIYKKYCHTWGIIHTGLIKLQYAFLKNGSYEQSLYDEVYHKCKKYGYDYVLEILEKLKHDECVITSLMFL